MVSRLHRRNLQCAYLGINRYNIVINGKNSKYRKFFVKHSNVIESKWSFAILDKAKPDTGNARGLNLAAVMFTTVLVSRLPL
jgi:hypothetical protein